MQQTNHIEVLPYQYRAVCSPHSTIVFCGGRGTGKTYSAALFALRKCIQATIPLSIGVISPTYAQSKIFANFLKHFLDSHEIGYYFGVRPPNGRLTQYTNTFALLMNHSEHHIHIKTAEIPQNLRGFSFTDLILDEAAFIPEETVFSVILPTRRGYPSWYASQLYIATSPTTTKSWVYRTYIQKQPNDDVLVISVPSWNNTRAYTPESIRQLRETLPELLYRSEIAAEWIEHDASTNVFRDVVCDTFDVPAPHKLLISLDINVEPGAGVICIKDVNQNIYVVDEIALQNATYQSYASAVAKLIAMYSAGKPVEITGDSSGNARSTSSERSFWDLFSRELHSMLSTKILIAPLSANPNVLRSAELVNTLFRAKKLMIHSRCRRLLQDLRCARYDAAFSVDKRTYDPHWADALRYGIWKWHHTNIQALEKLF